MALYVGFGGEEVVRIFFAYLAFIVENTHQKSPRASHARHLYCLLLANSGSVMRIRPRGAGSSQFAELLQYNIRNIL